MMDKVRFNFFGPLINDSGWIGLLSGQPVMDQVGLGRVTHFDSSTNNVVVLFWHIVPFSCSFFVPLIK